MATSFEELAKQIEVEVSKFVAKGISDAAQFSFQRVKLETPVRTGTLRAGWRFTGPTPLEIKASGFGGKITGVIQDSQIFNPVRYGGWVEEGGQGRQGQHFTARGLRRAAETWGE